MTEQAQLNAVLRSIRRIMRAVDIQSKQVTKAVGLTVPQVVILKTIKDNGPTTSKRLAEGANLSPATVVTILDKLEAKRLVERRRDTRDRRVVYTSLTDAGEEALRTAPPLLHHAFSARFDRLSPERRRQIIEALEDVAEMMGAKDMEAAPVLHAASLESIAEAT
ncbi:MarR family transcriptional regulator [Rhizobiales bacterium]|uniref:MarR family winged helix-turn-helix transcriptional regulator n=1 Tax=Hongsoonwoonella zoysiae TaxID=2821844 RepID=UPI0015619015|nr:MarR family transcriptional regulator [Hongsoonwoonella zoysiae]NRG17014.1 MarR family transcriptional regulator [Hongsoonwoonella zoysiae]